MRTVLRASGGGGCASSSSCLRSAEGFGVQHAEVQETGGEPASAEWFGRRVIGDCGAAVRRLTFCIIRTTMGSLTSASGSVMEVWFGRWPVPLAVSPHNSAHAMKNPKIGHARTRRARRGRRGHPAPHARDDVASRAQVGVVATDWRRRCGQPPPARTSAPGQLAAPVAAVCARHGRFAIG